MGLNDAHTIYGMLIGALFHSWVEEGFHSVLLPTKLASLLSVRFPRLQANSSLSTYTLTGIIISNIPDIDIGMAFMQRFVVVGSFFELVPQWKEKSDAKLFLKFVCLF